LGLPILSTSTFLLIKHRVIDFHHYSFYIGPAYEASLGKSLLSDSPSQYGYLSIHFIKEFLIPFGITPQSFHIFNLILFAIYFSLTFLIFQKVLKIPIVAFFLFIVSFFFQTVFSKYNAGLYPSTGPLRFGIGICVVLLLLYLPKKLKIGITTVLSAIALFWSIETAIYVVPAWIYVLLSHNFIHSNNLKKFVVKFLKDFGLFLLAGLGILSIILIKEYAHLHSLTQLSNYFQFATIYKNGYGSKIISSLGNQYIAISILVLGLTLSVFSIITKRKGDLFLVLNFLSIHNIAIFSYFISRSHENNIVNISIFFLLELVVCYKVIETVFFKKNKRIQFYKYALISTLLFCILFIGVSSSRKSNFRPFESMVEAQLPCVTEYRSIKKKYFPNQNNVLIISPKCDTPIILDNNIYTYLPLNPSLMTVILPDYAQNYILPNLPQIPLGTLIISTKDSPKIMNILSNYFILDETVLSEPYLFEIFTIIDKR